MGLVFEIVLIISMFVCLDFIKPFSTDISLRCIKGGQYSNQMLFLVVRTAHQNSKKSLNLSVLTK